jgi:stage II sporulation protein D
MISRFTTLLAAISPTISPKCVSRSAQSHSRLSQVFLGSIAGLSTLGLVNAAPAQAALELRVAIEDNIPQVQIGTSTAAVLRDDSGRVVGRLDPLQGSLAASSQGQVLFGNTKASALWIEPSANGLVWIGDGTNGRWFRGKARLVPSPKGLIAVNHVDMESYLYSVVASEMPPSWPLESLKAQAVAARSYVLKQRDRTANTVYDVGDDTRWQVYKGVEAETNTTQAAVKATSGQVMTYQGSIIEAVFHSSSGGHTENSEDVWSQKVPYLRAVNDYDQSAPVYSWTESFPIETLNQKLGVGKVLRLSVVESSPQGRVRRIKVEGESTQRVMTGEQLRTALNLRSSLFKITPQKPATTEAGGKSLAPQTYQIEGRGFGHGLGLSQYGAQALATKGWTYGQILTHYYKGATLSRIQVTR